MKIKKIIAAFCAAGAVLSLAGCGNSAEELFEGLTAGTSKPTSSSTKKPTSVSTSSKRESEPIVSEPTSEPAVESEATNEPISIPNIVDQKLLRPKVKDALDAYEAYMNEYCDFMKNYNAAADKSAWMTGYFAILEKYSIAMDKLSELDEIELTDAETAYYLEVTTRVLARMSETN